MSTSAAGAVLRPTGTLELVGVGKRYGQAWAIRNVSLPLPAGACTALLGENGAGKSTLIRIVGGLTHPTEGHLAVNGEMVRIRTPRDAQRLGIAIIPQELAYVPQLTVAENIITGRWPQRAGMISQRTIARHAEELVSRFGFALDVQRRMNELPLAERQLVEIVKVLARDARTILLDEPTAALTEVETERLLTILKGLKAAGKALVYVSHRLDECFQLAEHIAVMRNGALVNRMPRAKTSPPQVVEAMLGAAYHTPAADVSHRASAAKADAVLEVLNWQCEATPKLHGVSFTAAPGEVVGVFGLIGSGAETVARGLGGHETRIRGAVKITGKLYTPFRKPRDARRAQIGYLPAERKTDGLALGRPIRDNLVVQIMPNIQRLGIMRGRAETRAAVELIRDFQVRCASTTQPVGELSGGNQQKVLLASRIAASPRVLVLHEPTRGVDIGARAQIHQTLRNFAANGAAIVIVTSDVAEAVTISDRLLVIRDGQVAAEFSGSDQTQVNALSVATKAANSPRQVTHERNG